MRVSMELKSGDHQEPISFSIFPLESFSYVTLQVVFLKFWIKWSKISQTDCGHNQKPLRFLSHPFFSPKATSPPF